MMKFGVPSVGPMKDLDGGAAGALHGLGFDRRRAADHWERTLGHLDCLPRSLKSDRGSTCTTACSPNETLRGRLIVRHPVVIRCRPMLERLMVRGLGIIDAVEVELAPGFVALTGETGAGKSLLVTSLELLAGRRASSELVRTGDDRLKVEGWFSVDPGSETRGDSR